MSRYIVSQAELDDIFRRITALEATQRKRELDEIRRRIERLEISRGIAPVSTGGGAAYE